MSNLNPFELPEIRTHIASYLDGPELVLCLQVCKSWYNRFIPLIWKDVQVYYSHKYVRKKTTRKGAYQKLVARKGPLPEYLERHRQFVHSLRIEDEDSDRYAFNYPNLQKFAYSGITNEQETSKNDCAPIAFLELNPAIVELEISDYASSNSFVAPCLKVLRAHQHDLRKLTLRGFKIEKESLDDFWGVCERLELLGLLDFNINVNDFELIDGFPAFVKVDVAAILFTDTTYPGLRQLHYRPHVLFGREGQFELLRKFPGIEDLSCFRTDVYSSFNMTRCFETKMWSNLRKLSLPHPLKDSELAIILHEMNRATNLNFIDSEFGPLASQALIPHYSTVTELVLSPWTGGTSSMVRDILCNCPQLEHLQANRVLARDVVEGGPWVCHSLRRLVVYIQFSKEELELHPLIYARLSRLVKLRSLAIGLNGYRGNQYSCGLYIQLSQGLGALASLKELEYLSVLRTYQSVGVEEVRWIGENLKSLKVFHGRKNSKIFKVDKEICALLKQYGIKIHSF
ncbi:hypothetical protein BGZ80_008375 [Entomortierella chlamydospora]|uniref:F-box domain-containing protein n=1 Tax=Entomortierella chlamydospora TaxID=101097 RepID=A0A9P6MXK4_9FUNG|nr:hypothetical protein BGZ79_005413 [Entomortierella chlamydospora]KAG0017355.1 hypothetical protein BGZ80_008375 [Entomortierella chlamydospora]